MHDASLAEERELIDAVGAAAALALENERLDAELRARVEELRRSRARLVEVGPASAARLERNLHDGAQQRLVALALSLRLARGADRATTPAAPSALLDEAMAELARGDRASCASWRAASTPPCCPTAGCAPALEALAGRAPVPVDVDETPAERAARRRSRRPRTSSSPRR